MRWPLDFASSIRETTAARTPQPSSTLTVDSRVRDRVFGALRSGDGIDCICSCCWETWLDSPSLELALLRVLSRFLIPRPALRGCEESLARTAVESCCVRVGRPPGVTKEPCFRLWLRRSRSSSGSGVPVLLREELRE